MNLKCSICLGDDKTDSKLVVAMAVKVEYRIKLSIVGSCMLGMPRTDIR